MGKVSAERDDLLENYFFDNGLLKTVIDSPSSFLVLGRKGAGKTAVFRYLCDKRQNFISNDDLLIPLSFDDYNWNIHTLLVDVYRAESLAYKQSWRFVILTECLRAFNDYCNKNKRKLPAQINNSVKLLEKLFDSPIPTISQLVSEKLLSLSNFKFPKGNLDFDNGDIDNINLDGGNITFEQVHQDKVLQRHLSENIHNILLILERSVLSSLSELPRIFICFDRVDESWDRVSFNSSKLVIAGLVSAGDSITGKYRGRIRPIIFLREDIFDVLSLNDANKLREDCGALLSWNRSTLTSMLLHRINFFANQSGIEQIDNIDTLFDKAEMRQRTKPLNYLLKRTMMRPRDLISLFARLIQTMKEEYENSFLEQLDNVPGKLSSSAIYSAEPGYSEWLVKEVIDEWNVQKPEIEYLFNALRNNSTTNFNRIDLANELQKLEFNIYHLGDIDKYLKFLFDNSIIGFKLGDSTEWKFKCSYPSQGFLHSEEYRVHEGLVRALNLRENRDRERS